MAYVYTQHAHYVLPFLVLVVNSGFKFYGVSSHPFLCSLGWGRSVHGIWYAYMYTSDWLWLAFWCVFTRTANHTRAIWPCSKHQVERLERGSVEVTKASAVIKILFVHLGGKMGLVNCLFYFCSSVLECWHNIHFYLKVTFHPYVNNLLVTYMLFVHF